MGLATTDTFKQLQNKNKNLISENSEIIPNIFSLEDMGKITKSLGVKQAPTLVVIKDGVQENIVNLSNIKKHIESFKI